MVNKSVLNRLIKTHNLSSLEKHLVYSYLKNASIDFDSSPILSSYFNDFILNEELFLETSSLDISNIKELENYLELMIPTEDRKINGAFFTPDYIVDFIINEIQPGENEVNLDPSCGCGAFLVGLTEYYKRTYDLPIRQIIKNNIFGSDILEYNIHRTKLILTILALQNGEYLVDSDFNLYIQDSLRTEWKEKFDNIVGNPPYVKFQDLSNENREYLLKNWSTVKGGTFNLYFAFFELGYKLLKSSGKLGYITPNNYFTSLSGEALRNFFQKQKCITRIIDFTHKKVFDAQTYTAITFLNKEDNESIKYDRIKNEQNPELFLTNANGSPNFIKDLNVKKWRLLKSDEQENIRLIETLGKPIGKLFDISVGIATLKDMVYFIDSNIEKNGNYIKTTEKGTFEIEKEIVKSVYKISDFKTQEEIEHNTRRIICPYHIINGNAVAISENEFKNKYPNCYKYLLSEKDVLISRDKSKVIYNPFYVWGRTQGLSKFGKKLLTPTFSLHPRFLMVDEEDAFFTNGYGLYFKEQGDKELYNELSNPITKIENIDVVQKILNSSIMDYYVSKTSVAIEGGFPCYQKNFIEKFTIPVLTQEEINTIRSIGDPILIDELLIQLYQLNIPVPKRFSYTSNKVLINP